MLSRLGQKFQGMAAHCSKNTPPNKCPKSAGSSARILRSSMDYGIVTKNENRQGEYGRAVQEMDKNALFSEGRVFSCSDTLLTQKQQ